MAAVKNPVPVQLTCGLLFSDPGMVKPAIEILTSHWGEPCAQSATYPFDYSGFYVKEMGPGVTRQFLAFSKLLDPDRIVEAKLLANDIEEELSANGKRRINIDPGYLTLAKLIVPSTKDASYRIYIKDGIYAQPMLQYKYGTFHAWPWTYRDYQDPIAIDFYNNVREGFKTLCPERYTSTAE